MDLTGSLTLGYLTGAVMYTFSAIRGRVLSNKPGAVATNGLLAAMDDGHFSDTVMQVLEEASKNGESLPEVLDGKALAGTYGRWASRIAGEFKLEHGIPKRTVANRQMVREKLYKMLKARNTRYVHMRSVLPLAIELCFYKDASDLELDQMLQDPVMVQRAQESVKPFWKHSTWAGWIARTMFPPVVFDACAYLWPATFKHIPGFQE